MTWDYKKLPVGFFSVIHASPECRYWSKLRMCWIGRKFKGSDEVVTKETLQRDIDKYGKPQVDKVLEIITYFDPKYWIIENPKSSSMKNYIHYLPSYVVDYCKYSNYGYKKSTRFWTNIKNFTPKICKNDCDNIMINDQKKHIERIGVSKIVKDDGKLIYVDTKELREKYKDYPNRYKIHKVVMGGASDILKKGQKYGSSKRLMRYRIPSQLIKELLICCE